MATVRHAELFRQRWAVREGCTLGKWRAREILFLRSERLRQKCHACTQGCWSWCMRHWLSLKSGGHYSVARSGWSMAIGPSIRPIRTSGRPRVTAISSGSFIKSNGLRRGLGKWQPLRSVKFCEPFPYQADTAAGVSLSVLYVSRSFREVDCRARGK